MLLTENINQYITFLFKQMLDEKGDKLNVIRRHNSKRTI
jgi:hypothetical protein